MEIKKEPFAKGKRGIVYTSVYKGKKIAIKSKNPESTAIARIEIEADFLKKLNKEGIGPRFIFFNNDELGMEFIEGELIEKYIESQPRKKIINVLKDIFEQLYRMDELRINKAEMHRPVKHIIIRGNKPILIDFERCRYTDKPQNVTQFCQYLIKERMNILLRDKGINLDKDKMMNISRDYKGNISRSSLMKILRLLS